MGLFSSIKAAGYRIVWPLGGLGLGNGIILLLRSRTDRNLHWPTYVQFSLMSNGMVDEWFCVDETVEEAWRTHFKMQLP